MGPTNATVVDSNLPVGGSYTVQKYFEQNTLSTGTVILAPRKPPLPADGEYAPYARVFDVVAFVSSQAAPVQITLPKIAGMLLVYLPKGYGTPLTEIAAALWVHAKDLPAGTLPGPFGIGLLPNPVVHYAQVVAPQPAALGAGQIVLVNRNGAPPGLFNQQFDVHALLGTLAPASNSLAIPAGGFVFSLPNGFTTPLTEIAAAIENGLGGGPPTGVDNTE
jgi:hypothetical protein